MREIEIKAKVADKTKLLQAIANTGVTLDDPVTQHDIVYGLPGVPGASANNEPWLRIREETGPDSVTYYFTLKKSVTGQLDSIEHEVMVGDTTELTAIIRELGFELYSDITKVRRRAHFDIYEICVDSVNPIGDFIEAEMLCDDNIDYNGVIGQLWTLLESYGVSRDDEVTDGYDVMVKNYLSKR